MHSMTAWLPDCVPTYLPTYLPTRLSSSRATMHAAVLARNSCGGVCFWGEGCAMSG